MKQKHLRYIPHVISLFFGAIYLCAGITNGLGNSPALSDVQIAAGLILLLTPLMRV